MNPSINSGLKQHSLCLYGCCKKDLASSSSELSEIFFNFSTRRKYRKLLAMVLYPKCTLWQPVCQNFQTLWRHCKQLTIKKNKYQIWHYIILQSKSTILDKIVEKIVKHMFHSKTCLSNDQTTMFLSSPPPKQCWIIMKHDLFCSLETNIAHGGVGEG